MRTFALLTALICLVAADRADAQERIPLAFEARIGSTLPLADFEAQPDWERAEAGLAFGASVYMRILEQVALYAGYSEHSFGCRRMCEGMRGSGFDLGARVEPPAIFGIATWFRGGALVHKLRIDRVGADVPEGTITSDRAAGLELGGGATIALVPGLSATPGVRWAVYPADFPDVPGVSSRSVNYLIVDLGLRLAF